MVTSGGTGKIGSCGSDPSGSVKADFCPHAGGTLVLAALLAVALLVCPHCPLFGQTYRYWIDTTLPPERDPFGIGPTEFPIGSYALTYPDDRPVGELWPYFDSLDIDLVITWESLEGYAERRFDSLLHSPLRPPNGRLIPTILGDSKLGQAGHAQEIVFYPFDSSQMRGADYSREYPFEHLFTQFNDDSTRFNPDRANMRSEGAGPRESVYVPAQAGTKVASGVAYEWRPSQRFRFPEYLDSGAGVWKDRCRDCDALLNTDLPFTDHNRIRSSLYYITVKGHLFREGGASPSDTLLRLDLRYEIPRGTFWHDSTGRRRRAGENLRLPYTSLAVTKRDLMPAGSDGGDRDVYREVTFPVRLDSCDECAVRGPLGEGNASHRLDIEVVYLGGENVALRSVTLRDSVAHLMRSKAPEGIAYRDSLRSEVRSLIVDSATGLVADGIVSISPFGETHPAEYGGYRLLNEFFMENFRNREGDSLHYFVEVAHPYAQHVGKAELALPETYFNKLGLRPESHCCVESYEWGKLFGVKYNQIPSVRQHNGGRWNIPESFDIDELGNGIDAEGLAETIEAYEETIQTIFFGRYSRADPPWPYNTTVAVETGRYARTARANGIRLIPIVGPITGFRILPVDTRTGRRDTLVSHRPEAAELRTLTNMQIFGYGGKGLIYFLREADPWLEADSTADRLNCCMGYGGETVDQNDIDIADWNLRRPGTDETVVHINDFYLGYRTTYREMQRQHPWLIRIGKTLTRLRWRNAYSIHGEVRRPGQDRGMEPRPLPDTEIVTAVTARNPFTGKMDAPWETYVEIGLYDTVIDTAGGVHHTLRDTNYIGVCNRRSFETLPKFDLDYSGQAKALMDSATETRTIRLDLHLRHPFATDSGAGWTNVQVREVAPDTTSLPLIGRRLPLDTVVHADSAVLITLGPGRAALLEITYAVPNAFPGNGDELFAPGSGRTGNADSVGRPVRSDELALKSRAVRPRAKPQRGIPVDSATR